MRIDNVVFNLRDGRQALLGFAVEEDAPKLLEFLWRISSETPFTGQCADDVRKLTIEDEASAIRIMEESQDRVCMFCWVDNKIVGACDLEFKTRVRENHRATLGLSVVQAYWSLGIGSKMLDVALALARRQKRVTQVELDCYEYNNRAKALYEKFGFRTVSVFPGALRLDSGELLSEYRMMLQLY